MVKNGNYDKKHHIIIGFSMIVLLFMASCSDNTTKNKNSDNDNILTENSDSSDDDGTKISVEEEKSGDSDMDEAMESDDLIDQDSDDDIFSLETENNKTDIDSINTEKDQDENESDSDQNDKTVETVADSDSIHDETAEAMADSDSTNDETEDTMADSDLSDESVDGDETRTDESDENEADEDVIVVYCGSSVIEGPKECEKDEKKSCADLDASKYNWGETLCKDDCSGWEKSECIKLVRWGSTSTEVGNSIVVDKSDNIYFSGYTLGSIARPNNSKKDIVLTKFDSSLNEIWTKQFGTDMTDRSEAITQDNAGNIYIVGYTDGKMGEDPLLGGSDAFLMKVDSIGELKWTRQLGSANRDRGFAVAFNNNSIYVGVTTDGSIDNNQYNGKTDIAVVKFNTDGSHLWSVQYGTPRYDGIQDIDFDTDGNIIVGGYVGAGLNGVENIGGSSDILTMKLKSDGSELWTKIYGTNYSYWEIGKSVVRGEDGSLYITGMIGTGEPHINGVLVKYADNGEFKWSTEIASPTEDSGQTSAIDKSGYIYMAGHTKGLVGRREFGGHDIWVAKFDQDGTEIWKRQFGGSAEDRVKSIFFDSEDNLYIGGYTKSSINGTDADSKGDFLLIKILKENL